MNITQIKMEDFTVKKLLTPVICLASVFFLATNLLAWYPDEIPDLDLNNVDRSGVHEPTSQELSIPTVSPSTPLVSIAGSNVAAEGWTGGGYWSVVDVDPPNEEYEVHTTYRFSYWSPGETNEYFDIMWIFVYTGGTVLDDPVVSTENGTAYDHDVVLLYEGNTNPGSGYWPTLGNPEDWNLWVFSIDSASASEVIYWGEQMHQYNMEIYSQYFIPEPTTILLLLGSVIGLFVKKFKK